MFELTGSKTHANDELSLYDGSNLQLIQESDQLRSLFLTIADVHITISMLKEIS